MGILDDIRESKDVDYGITRGAARLTGRGVYEAAGSIGGFYGQTFSEAGLGFVPQAAGSLYSGLGKILGFGKEDSTKLLKRIDVNTDELEGKEDSEIRILKRIDDRSLDLFKLVRDKTNKTLEKILEKIDSINIPKEKKEEKNDFLSLILSGLGAAASVLKGLFNDLAGSLKNLLNPFGLLSRSLTGLVDGILGLMSKLRIPVTGGLTASGFATMAAAGGFLLASTQEANKGEEDILKDRERERRIRSREGESIQKTIAEEKQNRESGAIFNKKGEIIGDTLSMSEFDKFKYFLNKDRPDEKQYSNEEAKVLFENKKEQEAESLLKMPSPSITDTSKQPDLPPVKEKFLPQLPPDITDLLINKREEGYTVEDGQAATGESYTSEEIQDILKQFKGRKEVDPNEFKLKVIEKYGQKNFDLLDSALEQLQKMQQPVVVPVPVPVPAQPERQGAIPSSTGPIASRSNDPGSAFRMNSWEGMLQGAYIPLVPGSMFS